MSDWKLLIEIAGPTGDTARVEYQPPSMEDTHAAPTIRRVSTEDLGRALQRLNVAPQTGQATTWHVIADQFGDAQLRQAILRNNHGALRMIWWVPGAVVPITCRLDEGSAGELPPGCRRIDSRYVQFNAQLDSRLWDVRFTKERRFEIAYMYILPVPMTSVSQTSLGMYMWPFGNVYSDGHICWGNSNTPSATPEQARTLDEIFVRSPFNQDLATHPFSGLVSDHRTLNCYVDETATWDLRVGKLISLRNPRHCSSTTWGQVNSGSGTIVRS